MAELLVFNPMTSASEILMKIEISTTKHYISCKPIIPSRQLYTMKMTRKGPATTEVMTKMKATATMPMKLINKHKREKSLGVAGTVVLIVIKKK